MPAEVVFTLMVKVAGESQEFALSTQQMESLISSAGDSPEYAGLFSAAAQHSASSVRTIVASEELLPGDAALGLAQDPCAQVRAQLCRNRVFWRFASEETVLKLMGSDPLVADAIACNVEQFENADVNTLCDALVRHADPIVRRTLAWNSGTPLKWLKTLRADPMQEVAATASAMLTSRSR